jgi:hypothetical protein
VAELPPGSSGGGLGLSAEEEGKGAQEQRQSGARIPPFEPLSFNPGVNVDVAMSMKMKLSYRGRDVRPFRCLETSLETASDDKGMG